MKTSLTDYGFVPFFARQTSPDELAGRRRVLDAMNGRPPDGYEKAVDDYYERLLR